VYVTRCIPKLFLQCHGRLHVNQKIQQTGREKRNSRAHDRLAPLLTLPELQRPSHGDGTRAQASEAHQQRLRFPNHRAQRVCRRPLWR